MADTHTFEEMPVVDDQGDRGVCVKAAAAKAILAGLWHSKWTESRFDADQKFVLGLLHGDKDDILADINPTYLNGRKLRIQNEENKNWTEFTMKVQALTKKEFHSTWRNSKKEYLVGYQGHCLYVERVEKDGEELHCLNSHGDKNWFLKLFTSKIPGDTR